MKILKLILENFTNFKSAINTNKITIDFTKSKNPICLIIGPNGSGKTTTLSLLHPFATLGNLDERDGHELILQGENGYKEIHIENSGCVYVIKHFYSPNSKGNHSIKSYIEKDGSELNPNGNVTSFKEIVKDELDVEMDFLKLIRLGSNVTSLIKLTTTERKNFMSKLLDDVGVYLQLHKKVNMDLRELKDLMSHSDDKLKRLDITDEKDTEKKLKKLQNNLEDAETRERASRDRLSIYNHELSSLNSITDINTEIREHHKRLKKMEDTLERKSKGNDINDSSFFSEEINRLETEIVRTNDAIENSSKSVREYTDNIDILYGKIRDKKIRLEHENDMNNELNRMDENISNLKSKIDATEKLLNGFDSKCTLKEFEDFLVFLKTTNDSVTRCYQFGLEPVKEVTKLMREHKDVRNYINNHMSTKADTHTTDKLLSSIVKDIRFSAEIKCGQESTCEAYKLYQRVHGIVSKKETEEVHKDNDFYTYMDLIFSILMSVFPAFGEYKDTIEKLPKQFRDMFAESYIYGVLDKGEDIYNRKQFQDYLSLLTELNTLEDMKKELKETEEMKNTVSSVSNVAYLINEIEELENDVESYTNKVRDEKEKISSNKEKITDISRTLEEYNEIKDALNNYEDEKNILDKLLEQQKMYEENSIAIRTETSVLNTVVSEVKDYRFEIQRLTSALDQYISLKKDLHTFNNIYDEMTIVKSSLSSKNGIPLYYIDMYLGNTEELTNELLDIAYNGRIYIDKFKLTATEFAIPYFVNGKFVSDVRLASSGELTFLSLALSFALSSQSISKYNIMLLDEIDATLDQRNREKFIQILEKQIERIHSEQNFLITHNNMFSSYPVDILDFSFDQSDEDGRSFREQYPLANFIEIERE